MKVNEGAQFYLMSTHQKLRAHYRYGATYWSLSS